MEMFAHSSWQCWCSTQILSECFPSAFFAHLLTGNKASKDSARKEAMKSFYFQGSLLFTCHRCEWDPLIGQVSWMHRWLTPNTANRTTTAQIMGCSVAEKLCYKYFQFWVYYDVLTSLKKFSGRERLSFPWAASSYRLVKGSFWSAD